MAEFQNEVRQWVDIMYGVRMWRKEEDDVILYFKVFGMAGTCEDDRPVWSKDEPSGCSGTTDEMDDADLFLSGSIKWDGCSNMQFDEQEKVMLHFCGKQDVLDVGILLGRLYELAAELMPEHVEELS